MDASKQCDDFPDCDYGEDERDCEYDEEPLDGDGEDENNDVDEEVIGMALLFLSIIDKIHFQDFELTEIKFVLNKLISLNCFRTRSTIKWGDTMRWAWRIQMCWWNWMHSKRWWYIHNPIWTFIINISLNNSQIKVMIGELFYFFRL